MSSPPALLASPPRDAHGRRLLLRAGPGGDGQTYGFAGVDAERFDDPLPGRLERFRRRFAGFGGPVPAYLDALERDEQPHAGPIEWVEPDRWHEGRVVLVGDAAPAPPHMGEGGAMAMEDAAVLAELLRSAERSSPRWRGTPPGGGRGPSGCRTSAASPRGPGSCRPPSATARCADAATRCSATATAR